MGHQTLRSFIEQALWEGRSPGSIAGRINCHECRLPHISADSIERFLRSVYGRKIEAHRDQLKQKRKYRKHRPKVTTLTNRKFIDIRPKIINRRGRVGDVEADFIESGKSGRGRILTVADRKLRVSFLEKVLPVTIENVHRAFTIIQKRYPELRTITTDNDLLLQQHEALETLLGVKIYFCHPYHSWEKGTVENTNGEIRKYIPKGNDLSCYSSQFIRSVENTVNSRYMECLRFRTPQEALITHRKLKQHLKVCSKIKK